MSLTAEQWALLERIYQNLRDRPLSPDDPLYQPVYQNPGGEDPVDLMLRHIKFSGIESLQMLLWETKLPAAGYAQPATYSVNGRQYVVIACGGGAKAGSPTGDSYVAFALPNAL